jgi:hypothetical protein
MYAHAYVHTSVLTYVPFLEVAAVRLSLSCLALSSAMSLSDAISDVKAVTSL